MVYVCPPKLITKLAVPVPLGVPVNVTYRGTQAVVYNIPAGSVAVSPVTPVELTDMVLYVPPLPPV
jgi:hypothetical protein